MHRLQLFLRSGKVSTMACCPAATRTYGVAPRTLYIVRASVPRSSPTFPNALVQCARHAIYISSLDYAPPLLLFVQCSELLQVVITYRVRNRNCRESLEEICPHSVMDVLPDITLRFCRACIIAKMEEILNTRSNNFTACSSFMLPSHALKVPQLESLS
jgi:hypothetical protein